MVDTNNDGASGQPSGQPTGQPSGQSNDREHVARAFELWKETQGDRVSKEDELRVRNIRDAAHRGDTEELRQHLDDAKTQSNWLYDELVKHPQISAIFRELSIMGF